MATDTRIDKDSLLNLYTEENKYLEGYWAGVVTGRSDPGIRAVYIRYDEEERRPKLRLFSYDELIGTAWLIAQGVHRWVAAALVKEEYVIAAPFGAWVNAPREDYEFVNVMLEDGSEWSIGTANVSDADLGFVEDYAVWGSDGGKLLDLRSGEFSPRLSVISVSSPYSSAH